MEEDSNLERFEDTWLDVIVMWTITGITTGMTVGALTIGHWAQFVF